jgi:hypothetical protein
VELSVPPLRKHAGRVPSSAVSTEDRISRRNCSAASSKDRAGSHLELRRPVRRDLDLAVRKRGAVTRRQAVHVGEHRPRRGDDVKVEKVEQRLRIDVGRGCEIRELVRAFGYV